jgi:putative ATPase
MLARVRDRLFELAGINRDSMVLDLHARTGLLAFEAARKVTHGTVWALAHDEREFTTLRGMAAPLDELARPQVLQVAWETFDEQLAAAAGEGVLFTAIVGRNVLGPCEDKPALLRRILALLDDKGVIALAEAVPSMGQRVSELCDLSSLPKKLRSAFLKTEEGLYNDRDNPHFAWDAASLEKQVRSLKKVDVQTSTSAAHLNRRLSPQDVDFWFRTAEPGERPSLGQRLGQTLEAEEVDRLREHLRGQLANRDVSWKTVVAYYRISRT